MQGPSYIAQEKIIFFCSSVFSCASVEVQPTMAATRIAIATTNRTLVLSHDHLTVCLVSSSPGVGCTHKRHNMHAHHRFHCSHTQRCSNVPRVIVHPPGVDTQRGRGEIAPQIKRSLGRVVGPLGRGIGGEGIGSPGQRPGSGSFWSAAIYRRFSSLRPIRSCHGKRPWMAALPKAGFVPTGRWPRKLS